jgi:hypothetical protein
MKRTMYLMLTAFLLCSASLLAEDINGFTAIEVKNSCRVKVPGEAAYKSAELNQSYPFGTSVKTGRNSSMVLRFDDKSGQNTFQLLARTTLSIEENTKDAKLKILKLDSGNLKLTLDNFPKDHKLEVETPTAVCGAVGTRFVVSFEDGEEKAGSRKNTFDCSKGEVYVASRFRVGGAGTPSVSRQSFDAPSVKSGSSLVAVIHEGKENTYSDITVNRGKLTFNYGGDKGNSFSVEANDEKKPARFVVALEKSAKSVDMVALKVEDGTVKNTGPKRFGFKPKVTDITPENGAVVLKDKKVAQPDEKDEEATIVDDYIAATKKEGELHTKVEVMKKAEVPPAPAEVQAVEEQLNVAAAAATALRKKLVTKRMGTMRRHIRQGANKTNRIRR